LQKNSCLTTFLSARRCCGSRHFRKIVASEPIKQNRRQGTVSTASNILATKKTMLFHQLPQRPASTKTFRKCVAVCLAWNLVRKQNILLVKKNNNSREKCLGRQVETLCVCFALLRKKTLRPPTDSPQLTQEQFQQPHCLCEAEQELYWQFFAQKIALTTLLCTTLLRFMTLSQDCGLWTHQTKPSQNSFKN